MDDGTQGQKFAAVSEEDFFKMLAENVEDKKLGWKRSVNQKEKKGYSVIIYQRKVEGSKINLVRSDTKLKGVTLAQFRTFMDDVEKFKNDK